MNLSDVYVFNQVAVNLSFTKAANYLGMTRSTVSKQISRLEQGLGVVLINRTPRSVSLTEAGRTFHQQIVEIDLKIEHAAEAIRGVDLKPAGTVAFSLPSSLGSSLMPALINRFHANWPELKLSIHFEDGFVDLVARSYDLAIRLAQKLADSTMVSRRLGSTRKVLAASPGYIAKYGIPTHIEELKDHRCLALGSAVKTNTKWQFSGPTGSVEIPVTFAVSANNHLALILAARLDNGILYIPQICISNELSQQRLQVILPEFGNIEKYGIYAIYPYRKATAKAKVLVDFIEQELAAMETIDRCAPLTSKPGLHTQHGEAAEGDYFTTAGSRRGQSVAGT